MFESAELGQKIDDATYERELEQLRLDLLTAQTALLADRTFPVIVLVNGVEGAGKGETVNVLHEWLDPRNVRSVAFDAPDEAERARPAMWRYWRALPPKGKIGILFGSWYTDPITAHVKHGEDGPFETALERIRAFEQMLVDDGAVLVKLWFHLSKKDQKKRFEELAKHKLTSWKVTPEAWKAHDKYDRIHAASEHVLRATSTGAAPWLVIDGLDANYRSLTAGRALLAALRGRLAAPKGADKKPTATPSVASMLGTVDTSGILKNLTFRSELDKDEHKKKLKKEQAKLGRLSRSPKVAKHAVVAVFEGMDAAGKGGAIRRVTQAIDARRYEVVPIAAPTDEERAYPYLWRFWRHLPKAGQTVIFDRSWYGRVLVERVEGFATDEAWSRAYREIVDFEEQLAERGIIVLKFWLAISNDEQKQRFEARQQVERKQYKITEEDWRNRKRWDDYIVAASDMIDRTSTKRAPWTIIEANDKHFARAKVVETFVKRVEDETE